MKLGDLVSYIDGFWVVTRYDPKRTRTATLRNATGTSIEVPHDESVSVLANPSQEWPFIAAPIKPKWGPITTLVRPSPSGTITLTLYQDWIPSEPSRAGGSLFLNPNLRLQIGDYLLATHANGTSSSIVISTAFGTVHQRQTRAAAKPKPDRTAYTRLLDDVDPFDDDS